MHSRVAACIVDEHLAVLVGNPSVCKGHVHHIADILLTLRHEEISTWLGNHTRGIVEGCHIHIEHIAQTAGATTHSVGKVEPSLGGLDGMRTLAVLHLHNGVIMTCIDNLLFLNLGICDVVNKCPTDATARTGVDESVLRTGVEGILAIHKLRMENDVALLTLGLEVGQTLPVDEVFCACNGGSGCCSREVSGLRVIVTLCTEDTVDISVLMCREAHVVDICSGNHIFGHCDWLWPEAEVVDAVRTLSHCEEALAVGTLHTHNKHILAVPLDGTGVECGVHHDTLHQVGIVLLAEVISPLKRCVSRCEDRVLILLVNAVILSRWLVGLAQQFLMRLAQSCHSFIKITHDG